MPTPRIVGFSNISLIIFDTVVLPFVPVTPIMVFGLSNIPIKPGHISNANFPG